MIYLALGIALGTIAGFTGAVIYVRTYLKSIEQIVSNIEDRLKDFKIVYNITVPSSSTSVGNEEQETEDLFKPF